MLDRVSRMMMGVMLGAVIGLYHATSTTLPASARRAATPDPAGVARAVEREPVPAAAECEAPSSVTEAPREAEACVVVVPAAEEPAQNGTSRFSMTGRRGLLPDT